MGTETLFLSLGITAVVLLIVLIFLVLFKWKVAFSIMQGEETFHIVPSGVVDENARSFKKLKKKIGEIEKFHIKLSKETISGHIDIAEKLVASDNVLRSDLDRTNQALQAVLSTIRDLREETKILREEIQTQAQELERHRKGYDVDILSVALIPIAKMHRELLNDIDNDSIPDEAKNTLTFLKDQYLGVLETNGVRLVHPGLGERFRDQKNIHHRPRKTPTENPDLTGRIAAVIHPAYELETSARNVILLPAEVQIYSYQDEKSAGEIESVAVDNEEQ